MIRVLQIFCTVTILSTFPVAAQVSVGTSSSMNIGWSAYNKSTNRYTRVNQRGTSGENIVPENSNGQFKIYGSEFKVNDKSNSFDYSSIANDNHTVTDIQKNNFSVFASTNGISTRTTSPSLGWFGRGNSSFSR